MNNTSKLVVASWGERFALLDHYKPIDSDACDIFGLSIDELKTARDMRQAGTFVASKTINVNQYSEHFMMSTPNPIVTVTVTKPETATKKVAIPKKRGRKGINIHTALLAVPTQPVEIDTFMQQYGVSLAVLRQAKRFALAHGEQFSQQVGTINVRKDKATKRLMIWKTS